MRKKLSISAYLAILGLFVDVGENTSILDRINLTFVYDDVSGKGTSKQSGQDEIAVRNY